MTTQQPSPGGIPESDPGAPTSTGGPAGEGSSTSVTEHPAATSDAAPRTTDPLRGSRTSGIWGAVVALVVVLILLAVFILQNTQQTEVNYFGWTGTAPVSAALLIAAAGGALIVAAAGMLRILQLRRRVKKERKRR